MYKFDNSVKNLRFSMSDNSRRFALLCAIMKFVVYRYQLGFRLLINQMLLNILNFVLFNANSSV